MGYSFRPVHGSDKEAIVNIFNYFVENSFAAYPYKKVDSAFFEMLKEMAHGYPFYVMETDDRHVVGFGLLRRHHTAEVFKRVPEITYFILPPHTGKGLGKQLLDILVKEGKKLGIDSLLASSSSLNKVSLDFHEKNGFEQCGMFRRIGKKFGKDFDVVWMQRFICEKVIETVRPST